MDSRVSWPTYLSWKCVRFSKNSKKYCWFDSILTDHQLSIVWNRLVNEMRTSSNARQGWKYWTIKITFMFRQQYLWNEKSYRNKWKYILKNKIPQTLSNNLSLIRNYYFWNYKHFKIFLILIELNQIPRYMINLFIF